MERVCRIAAALALILVVGACTASPTGPDQGDPRSCPTMGSGNC